MTGTFALHQRGSIKNSMRVKRSPADEFSSESLQTLSERLKSDGKEKVKVVSSSERLLPQIVIFF